MSRADSISRTWGQALGASPASSFAYRLESLLHDRAAQRAHVTEEELDAIADAAWSWLQRDGRDGFPERVIVLLDAVRARHAHD